MMYGSRVFSGVPTITERSGIGLFEVPMLMSLLDFGMLVARFLRR